MKIKDPLTIVLMPFFDQNLEITSIIGTLLNFTYNFRGQNSYDKRSQFLSKQTEWQWILRLYANMSKIASRTKKSSPKQILKAQTPSSGRLADWCRLSLFGPPVLFPRFQLSKAS